MEHGFSSLTKFDPVVFRIYMSREITADMAMCGGGGYE